MDKIESILRNPNIDSIKRIYLRNIIREELDYKKKITELSLALIIERRKNDNLKKEIDRVLVQPNQYIHKLETEKVSLRKKLILSEKKCTTVKQMSLNINSNIKLLISRINILESILKYLVLLEYNKTTTGPGYQFNQKEKEIIDAYYKILKKTIIEHNIS